MGRSAWGSGRSADVDEESEEVEATVSAESAGFLLIRSA